MGHAMVSTQIYFLNFRELTNLQISLNVQTRSDFVKIRCFAKTQQHTKSSKNLLPSVWWIGFLLISHFQLVWGLLLSLYKFFDRNSCYFLIIWQQFFFIFLKAKIRKYFSSQPYLFIILRYNFSIVSNLKASQCEEKSCQIVRIKEVLG